MNGQLLPGGFGESGGSGSGVAFDGTVAVGDLVKRGAGNTLTKATGGSGDVVGPSSATDNALVRYNSTTGKLVQNGLAILGDGGELFTPGFTQLGGVYHAPTSVGGDTPSLEIATTNSGFAGNIVFKSDENFVNPFAMFVGFGIPERVYEVQLEGGPGVGGNMYLSFTSEDGSVYSWSAYSGTTGTISDPVFDFGASKSDGAGGDIDLTSVDRFMNIGDITIFGDSALETPGHIKASDYRFSSGDSITSAGGAGITLNNGFTPAANFKDGIWSFTAGLIFKDSFANTFITIGGSGQPITFDAHNSSAIFNQAVTINGTGTITGNAIFGGGQKVSTHSVGAGNYSVTNDDYIVMKTVITPGGDIITLPDADLTNHVFFIGDSGGNASTSSPIVVSGLGGKPIGYLGSNYNITNSGGGIWVKTNGGNYEVLGVVAGVARIADGGTGAQTKTAAFDNLSPLTTKGDIIVYDGTDNIRLPVGSDGQFLIANSSVTEGISWNTGTSLINLAIATLNSPSGTNAVTVNNSAGINWNIPVTGTDATLHQYLWEIDGGNFLGMFATGDGAGSTINKLARIYVPTQFDDIVEFDGHIGIGAAANDSIFYLENTKTVAASDSRIFRLNLVGNAGASANNGIRGLTFDVRIDGSGGATAGGTDVIGVVGAVGINQTGADWQSVMTGFHSQVTNQNSANITEVSRGFRSDVGISGAGNMTEFRHFSAEGPAATSTGVFTSMYGFYIDTLKITGVTNAWGVYQKGANDVNYFNGNMLLGTATNDAAGAHILVMKNGTAPTGQADTFGMYANDITAGNSAPHFKTEAGNVVKLFTSSAYTITNVTPDRSYDADSTTLDEIADALGTLIADLQLTGLIG